MPHYSNCKDGNNLERSICTKQKISQFIEKNIIIPEKAIEKSIQGTVYVRFVVGVDGSIKDVEIIKGVHPLLDDAAMNAISKLPNMIPGKQSGKNVPVFFQVPVRFVVDGKKRLFRRKKS